MGEPKAIVAARKLTEINPNVTIKGYHSSLERVNPANKAPISIEKSI